MNTNDVPVPGVMKVPDRESWRRQLNLSNFVNTYYQFRDVEALNAGRRLLIIGVGQGLDTQVFRWRGYDVLTFDIDEALGPDVVGSVHDLAMFEDDRFDVAIASHVVEHIAVPHLDKALSELARVARYALVYLPIAGRPVHLRFTPHITPLDVKLVFDVFNYFDRPDELTPKYNEGNHYWEIGRPGWSLRAVRKRLSKHFDLLHDYRNYDWIGSHNFVLRSKR